MPVIYNDMNKDRNVILTLKDKLNVNKVNNALLIPVIGSGGINHVIVLLNKFTKIKEKNMERLQPVKFMQG